MRAEKRQLKFHLILILSLACLIPLALSQGIKASTRTNSAVTNIDRKHDLLFANTIDGTLHAIGKYDGKVKWSVKEDSVIKFSKNNDNPYFLTDPRDGSLYIFTSKEDGGLKKFPYTIAELVSASPSKSTDGFLYTGDKKDQWLAIDYRTGYKLDTLTAETLSSKISIADENVVFIGRTQYVISMFDVVSRKKVFNMTYYDYSTHSSNLESRPTPPSGNINDEYKRYPYYHFTSNSDGTLVTLDKKDGNYRWKLNLKNPVIAMYRYENEQLFKVNFQVFSTEALTSQSNNKNSYKHLYKQQKLEEKNFSLTGNNSTRKPSTFVSSLYVGFFEHNLYALPSLVYNSHMNLIEGPTANINNEDQHQIVPFPISPDENASGQSIEDSGGETSLGDNNIIGHHKLPENFDPPPDYIQPNKNLIVISNKQNDENTLDLKDLFSGKMKKQDQCLVKKPPRIGLFEKLDNLMQNKYVWSLFTVLLASLFPLSKTIYDYRKKKARQLLKKQQQKLFLSTSEEETDTDDIDGLTNRYSEHKHSNSSRNSSKGKKSRLSNYSSDRSRMHESISAPVFSENLVKIGKITYNPKEVLGHGCSGTFVYKGTFENRSVAVKRLLPDCWILADREVDLLRDADQHRNVLRYFCTESDSQFKYIALELCQMSLNDYIRNVSETYKRMNSENNNNVMKRQQLGSLDILEQATKGLDHLHSLDIVHRDIKPQNILISFPDAKGKLNIMISDFGLCKRLEIGKNYFSNRSGVIGTEGWIAAELISHLYDSSLDLQNYENSDEMWNSIDKMEKDINKKVTKAVDIFSMGCVYYFVLSSGGHPFGEPIQRQMNIMSNQYKLDKLSSTIFSELYMQKVLIDKMISLNAQNRPLTNELLAHPVFWSKAKTLQFLQDVSDRLETEDPNDTLIIELEKNANQVLKNNWKTHICQYLSADLNKFRRYNGVSVRDLLRAIRNKKHHYRELPDLVKSSLGSVPDEFIDYFTYRFPKLIMHVYRAMFICRDEPIFHVYYDYKERL